MGGTLTALIVLIVLAVAAAILVFLVALVIIYNKLVRLRNTAEQAWSDVEVQLQRRHDLIPNLVETVKGYMTHERETLEAVTKARQMAVQVTGDVAKRAEAENMLTQTLRSLFAVAENYPQLKANENFLDLQQKLAEIEEQIQLARRYYNAVVRDLNNAIDMFPSNIVAKIFHFQHREYFELTEPEAEEAPEVKF
ncbi:MAG TPA: LemA family protein [candidate division Zixibacteria bacterium]|nr:LemA family protein [candidate division Zixibacteria bacterium]